MISPEEKQKLHNTLMDYFAKHGIDPMDIYAVKQNARGLFNCVRHLCPKAFTFRMFCMAIQKGELIAMHRNVHR